MQLDTRRLTAIISAASDCERLCSKVLEGKMLFGGGFIKLGFYIILQHGVVVVVGLIIKGDVGFDPMYFQYEIDLCPWIMLYPSVHCQKW